MIFSPLIFCIKTNNSLASNCFSKITVISDNFIFLNFPVRQIQIIVGSYECWLLTNVFSNLCILCFSQSKWVSSMCLKGSGFVWIPIANVKCLKESDIKSRICKNLHDSLVLRQHSLYHLQMNRSSSDVLAPFPLAADFVSIDWCFESTFHLNLHLVIHNQALAIDIQLKFADFSEKHCFKCVKLIRFTLNASWTMMDRNSSINKNWFKRYKIVGNAIIIVQ